jgi:hypothetical protein
MSNKGKIVFQDKNKGKIYEGGRFLADVEYNLTQYEQPPSRRKAIGFIKQKPKPSTWIEAYIRADDVSVFTVRDVTLELADGRRIDGDIQVMPANLVSFMSKKAPYKP